MGIQPWSRTRTNIDVMFMLIILQILLPRDFAAIFTLSRALSHSAASTPLNLEALRHYTPTSP